MTERLVSWPVVGEAFCQKHEAGQDAFADKLALIKDVAKAQNQLDELWSNTGTDQSISKQESKNRQIWR